MSKANNANASSAQNSNAPNANSGSSQGANLLNVGEGAANNNAWFLAEGVAGQGEKPDYFIDTKYKSLAEQAKAYPELVKTHGELATRFGAFSGAPEKYDVKLPDELKEVEFDHEDPLFKDFEVFAKESNMSNDSFNKLLSVYARYEKYVQESAANEEKAYLVEEVKKLGGEKWSTERQEIKDWIQNRLPVELQETAKEFGNSAANVQLLKYLMKQSQFPTIPGNNGNKSSSTPSDLAAMMADKRYLIDQNYQKMVDAKYAEHYRN